MKLRKYQYLRTKYYFFITAAKDWNNFYNSRTKLKIYEYLLKKIQRIKKIKVANLRNQRVLEETHTTNQENLNVHA